MIIWQAARAESVAARVAVAGDFLPAGDLTLPRGGWGEAARALAPHFADCALGFANLECSLDSASLPPRPLTGLGQTVSAPSESLSYLRALGCTIVGSANNHSFDFGPTGAARTRAAIARAGLVPLGTTPTLRDCPDVFIWQGPAGIRVGFWAAAIASRDLATRTSPGVEPATVARAQHAIREMKLRGVTTSIALLHAGCLRTSRCDPAEAECMDRIASCGFMLVTASHSHRISGARVVGAEDSVPSFCFYGLGSIVSGFSTNALEREGLIVVACLTARGSMASIELRPVRLNETGFGSVPCPQDAADILNRFRSLSEEIRAGSAAHLFYRDVGRGLVRLYVRDVRAAMRQSGIRGLASKVGRMRLRHLQRLVRAVMP